MSDESRKGKRGHENGNVRPADGRYGLHEPDEESEYVRTDKDADKATPRKAKQK